MIGLVPGVYQTTAPAVAPPQLATGVPLFFGYGSPGASSSGASSWSQWSPVVALTAQAAWSALVPWSPDVFLRYAVEGFFRSGGAQCRVVLLDRAWAYDGDATGPDYGNWTTVFDAVLPVLDDADLVCAPSLLLSPITVASAQPIAGGDALGNAQLIQAALVAGCEAKGTLFAILDSLPLAPGTADFVSIENEQLGMLLDAGARRAARSGAIYFPWVQPYGSGAPFVPPSGHVAGVYATADASTGVERPPANFPLEGVADVAFTIADLDQAALDVSVNCLRAFPGRGILVWGARTLAEDTDWRYVSIRRLFITVARWLAISTAWAVFEPNDLRLWLRLTRQINAYLLGLYNRGVLKGSGPQEAFYVRCDANNNTPTAMGGGQVNVELGLAPAIPGEQIIVRLAQSPNGAQVTVES